MPGLFDDIINSPRDGSSSPPTSPSVGRQPTAAPKDDLFDDILALPRRDAAAPAEPKPEGPRERLGVIGDVVQSAGAGIIKGAAGLVDTPQTLYGFVDGLAGQASDAAVRALGFTPSSQRGIDIRDFSAIPAPSDLPRPGAKAVEALESATGKLHEPQTRAGRFAGAAAEFVPGAGKKLGEVVAYGLLPGLASEGAGQLTEGSALEPAARIGAAVATGLGGAVVRAPSNAQGVIARRAEGVSPAQVDRAEALFQEAATRGLPLTRANALDAVTNGATSLSDVQRVMEGNGRLRGYFASTADGVGREGRATLDTVAPAGAAPTRLGGEVQDAARAGIAQTPEGQALTAAREAAGPRVTAEQAGQTIQPALRQVYERREGMRAALADQEYAAARQAPEGVGIERSVTVERPGEPVVTQPTFSRPQFSNDAPLPLPAAPAAAATAQPQGLVAYLAKNGGIPLDAEARAADLNRLYVPGGGTLARRGAPSWDDLRVRLAEDGFLPSDGADYARAESVRDFVLDAIHRERIGKGRTVRMEETGAEGARRGQAADEYGAALGDVQSRLDDALTRAGVSPDSVHPDIRSRALNQMMGDPRLDALDAYEGVVGALLENPRPFSKSTTITEEIPDVRFGQANPQAVVDHIDEVLRSAKGPVAKALSQARETLFTRGADGGPRELDLSVAGLDGARDAINDQIARADPRAQAALLGVRERLDRALASVPEYERARSGYEAASRPLDAFGPGTAPGRVVDRDAVSGRMTMPAERVPEALAEGPSTARQFNAVATPEARAALEGRLTTQFLDGATDTSGAVTASSIREAMRRHEDLLAQYPAVRDSLERVAFARDGLDRVMRSPLGQIAQRPDVAHAIETLFPMKPATTGRAPEVGEAIRRVARNSPRAAQDMVRMHMEVVLNEALRPLASGANQAAGPRFSRALAGNPEQAATLEAAMTALPGGSETWAGIRRLLDIFDAQGKRQAVGSGTSFNNAIMTDLEKGTPIGEAGAAVITGGLKLPGRMMDKIEGWRMGRGLDEMAALFTDPKMASTFRRLALHQDAGSTARLASLIVDRAVRGYGMSDRPNGAAGPKREPLKLSVRPGP